MRTSRTHNVSGFYGLLSIAVLGLLISGCSGSPAGSVPSDTSSSADVMSSASSVEVHATSSSSVTAVVPQGSYADGTYQADGAYAAPSGAESIGVKLTLKKGVITDASVDEHAMGGRSRQFQDLFAQGFKEQVVGKSIDSVSLGVVNGSSLTPIGFMDALSKIKTQAHS